jgi:hypothetical protein
VKLKLHNSVYWRGLLPGLWLSWSETELAVVIYIDGPADRYPTSSILSLEAVFEIPERVERWLLPRYEDWQRTRSWIT